MTIIENNKIIIPDSSLITANPDFIPIKANKNIISEIEQVKGRIDRGIKSSNLKEFETFSVDSFSDEFVNNSEIQKDLDDGFKAIRTGYGYLLQVNISSPSSVIDIHSEIFKNIIMQTTSIYYDSHVNPMMPFELSNKLFSLIYNELRLGLTVSIELDHDGNVLNYKINKSVIKNILMSNHAEFDRILNKKSDKNLNKFSDNLKVLQEIGTILKNKRKTNNNFSASFDSQRKIGYNKQDYFEINYISNIVEEIMVLCNSIVADFVIKNPQIAGVFRNHMPEYKGQKILGQMDRAYYSTKMEYHLGLLMDKYTHFTSPIRRAPDLLLHYVINNFLDGKPQTFNKENIGEYLDKYLNKRQEFLILGTNKYNKEIKEKQIYRAEKKKAYFFREIKLKSLKNDFEKTDINEHNIHKLSDIKFINYLKYLLLENKEIDISVITQIKFRINTKTRFYNKVMPILLLSGNMELKELFIDFFEERLDYKFLLIYFKENKLNPDYNFYESRRTRKIRNKSSFIKLGKIIEEEEKFKNNLTEEKEKFKNNLTEEKEKFKNNLKVTFRTFYIKYKGKTIIRTQTHMNKKKACFELIDKILNLDETLI